MRNLIIRKWLAVIVALGVAGISFEATANEVFVENLTTTEIAARQQQGAHRLIIYVGSTEQNGNHLVVGKHNRIAQYLAGEVARRLGDTLVYPIVPFAPTGDPAKRSGHMAWPGSISLRPETFSALISDLVLSGIANGFKRIYLMGDHGEGQDAMAEIAGEIDANTRTHGVRVHYIPEAYELGDSSLPPQQEPAHAGPEDTAMLLAIEPKAGEWVRKGTREFDEQRLEGQQLLRHRIESVISRIRQTGSTAP